MLVRTDHDAAAEARAVSDEYAALDLEARPSDTEDCSAGSRATGRRDD